MKKLTTYRQGDVLLIEGAPKSKSKKTPIAREAGRVVLAHGELTGHSHAIAHKEALFFALDGIADRLLELPKISALKHEEHATIKLPAGSYTVRIQKEYAPEDVRNVAD
jgi:hypothetical protein